MLKLEKVVDPFEDPRELRDFQCVWLSSILPTPLTERRLREFGIDDVYRAICERPDVYLLAHDGVVATYRYYMHRRFGIETTCELVFPTQEDVRLLPGKMPKESRFAVYRLGVAGSAGDTAGGRGR
jgi:hypothetical protein